MAYKVFGNPITEETLKGMPEYANKSIITHVNKAHVAFSTKSTVEAQVREYMENLQKQVPGDIVSTIGTIYNATGDIVTFYTNHDYSGKSADGSVYPVTIKNGQCGVFLHGGTKEMGTEKCNGSCGAVVYPGRNNNEEVCDWMMSWSNPISVDNLDNKVYTEIAEHGHYKPYPKDPVWIEIREKLLQSGSTSKYIWKGCESYMISTRISNSIVVVDALMVVN
ncbi:hypothetical protein LOK49_LG02G01945 [Camellia lanceoleosa]|uniref:Uncharacterized protein n=1 Tax=Camellia lanceoleosa TaxID=1840588 RepID=A0ACC0ISA4_9ERIC|nr:hypothetical protein LOK49_LG02G01945 [Camellia lanceoleosa]